jgi:pimeloyl-ACP methyl ester carboxylesterase
MLQVPLDYAHPNAGTISIALDRIPATGSKVGSLLLNPGGPGASGLDFLPQVAPQLGSSLRQHFDLIGFDPRGVGQSTSVNCGRAANLDRYLQVDGAPPTPTGVNALLAANEQLIAECKAGSGKLLGQVGTVDAARDMDRIRQALGDPKLNYLGFSYGTFLGATYADLFPTHIRVMVLDGAIDPSLPAIQEVDTQSAAVDKELGDFFDWCAANASSCGWAPGGGRAAMEPAVLALVNSTRQQPLAATGTNRSLGPNQVLYGIADGLYDQSSWPQLGNALQSASNHDGSQLLSMYDDYVERNTNGTYSNQVVADDAVSCDDQPWPSAANIEAAAPQAQAMAPVFGLANLYSGLLCTAWPSAPSDHPHRITAPGSPPIVVVGSTGDPATPYAWAQSLASQLSKGVLLTRVGVGHTGYLFSSCVRNNVDTYLITGQPPAAGTTCQSDSSSP